MQTTLEMKEFEKTLENIVQYSYGFIEGVNRGKKKFLDNIGKGVIEALGQYIDAMARGDRDAMHHVYEWYQTGSPEARLFDLDYTVSNLGLSVGSTFRQSSSVSQTSNTPFYDKARIMEYGVPITIRPRPSSVLRFNSAGTEIFTSRPITVNDPGGTRVEGSYREVFDSFFKNYFSQAFLRASGILDYIQNPVIYKKEIKAGSKGGRSVGVKVGEKWIINAKLGVD